MAATARIALARLVVLAGYALAAPAAADPFLDRAAILDGPGPLAVSRESGPDFTTAIDFPLAPPAPLADAWWLVLPRGAPSRFTADAVLDAPRRRMIVVGGSDGFSYRNEVHVLGLGPEDAPEWRLLAVAGSPPAARRLHTTIYDPVRQRVILFGGYNGSFLSDVWALTLAGPPAWVALAPTGPVPPARAGHAAIYDPAGDRMIVCGGFDGVSATSQRRNDVWSLDLATLAWSSVTPAGPAAPAPRSSHSAIHDPVRARLVIFGGTTSSTAYSNEAWALDLGGTPAWTLLATSGTPPGREEHAAIYDPAGDRLLVHGGYDAYYYYGGLHALSLATGAWTTLGSGPGARWGACAVFDPVRGEMVMYGGYPSAAETWAYRMAGDAWRLVDVDRRAQPAGVLDPMRHRMVVFGGTDGQYRNDCSVIELGGPVSWRPLVTQGPAPPPRRMARAVWDAARDRLIVHGGYAGAVLGDLWALDFAMSPPAWTPLSPAGPRPSARAGHGLVLDSNSDRLVLFGGFDPASSTSFRRNDVWVLPLGGPLSWQEVTPAVPGPSPRSSFGFAYHAPADRLVIHGGTDPAFRNDTWALDLAGPPSWQPLATNGEHVPPREEHTLVSDAARNRIVLHGGYESFTRADAWTLPMTPGAAWTHSSNGPALWGHVAAFDPLSDRMIVHGGYGGGYSNQTWALAFDAPTAIALALVSAEAGPDGVRLEWWSDAPGGRFTVQRSGGAGGWEDLATLAADGRGRVVWTDASAVPGRRHGYRLSWPEAGAARFGGETWIARPVALELAVHPLGTGLRFRCELPADAPSALELIDLGGRRLRRAGLAGAGVHEVDLAAGGDLPPGIYFARLTQQGRIATARAVRVR